MHLAARSLARLPAHSAAAALRLAFPRASLHRAPTFSAASSAQQHPTPPSSTNNTSNTNTSSNTSSSSSSSASAGGMADPRCFQTDPHSGRLHVHEGLLPARARGAVFDLDGTLLDTNDRRVESWAEACSKRGLRMDKDTYMALTGMAGHEIVDKLCRDQGVDLPGEERRALVAEESRLFKERGLPRSAAVRPVMDVLEEAQRRGLKLAVCSGGRKDAVERSLAERGLADRFQAVVTSADVQHCKPAPDIFVMAAEKLGLKPEECVAYEDAVMGQRSARAAGYLAVIDVTGLEGHPQHEEQREEKGGRA